MVVGFIDYSLLHVFLNFESIKQLIDNLASSNLNFIDISHEAFFTVLRYKDFLLEGSHSIFMLERTTHKTGLDTVSIL